MRIGSGIVIESINVTHLGTNQEAVMARGSDIIFIQEHRLNPEEMKEVTNNFKANEMCCACSGGTADEEEEEEEQEPVIIDDISCYDTNNGDTAGWEGGETNRRPHEE